MVDHLSKRAYVEGKSKRKRIRCKRAEWGQKKSNGRERDKTDAKGVGQVRKGAKMTK